MKRKHMPGCYCCTPGDPGEVCPTACCAEDEDWPTFAPGVNWSLRSRLINQDCCCLTEEYDYTGEPVEECCELAGNYEYVMSGERDDFAFKKTIAKLEQETQCAPPSCPEDCCQNNTPELVATWVDTFTHTQNFFFVARVIFDALQIKYGKEFIQCPGDEEPVCRYFMKYTIFGHYEARIDIEHIVNSKRENTYLHPCWTYTDDPSTPCTALRSSVRCNFDETIIHLCEEDEQSCEWPPDPCCFGAPSCLQAFDNFCVERIKYFDEPPSGLIGFTDEDINTPPGGNPEEYCEDPICDSNCNNGYSEGIYIYSGTPTPPFWYTNPPTKVSTTYNFLVEWDWCNNPSLGFLYSTVAAPLSCCEPATSLSVFCDPVSCEDPETTISITCEQFTDARLNITPDPPETCRLPFYYIGPGATDPECGELPGGENTGVASILCNSLGGSPPVVSQGSPATTNCIGCFFPFNGPLDQQAPACGPWVGNCMQYIPAEEPACDEDCFVNVNCGGCFCYCVPKFLNYGFFSSNTASFTTSGSWSQKSCIYTGFNLTITVNT